MPSGSSRRRFACRGGGRRRIRALCHTTILGDGAAGDAAGYSVGFLPFEAGAFGVAESRKTDEFGHGLWALRRNVTYDKFNAVDMIGEEGWD
jgi:hypothetical protein